MPRQIAFEGLRNRNFLELHSQLSAIVRGTVIPSQSINKYIHFASTRMTMWLNNERVCMCPTRIIGRVFDDLVTVSGNDIRFWKCICPEESHT